MSWDWGPKNCPRCASRPRDSRICLLGEPLSLFIEIKQRGKKSDQFHSGIWRRKEVFMEGDNQWTSEVDDSFSKQRRGRENEAHLTGEKPVFSL